MHHPIPSVPTPSPHHLSGAPSLHPPPPLPSCWNPQSPARNPARPSSRNPKSGRPVGAVWAKPSAAQNRFPRQAPGDMSHLAPTTLPHSQCPLPGDLPIPSVLFTLPYPHVPAPPPPSDHHSLATMPSPLTPTPNPRTGHDKHSISYSDRTFSPTTPSRPQKRAASTSWRIANGTVPGSWSGAQFGHCP